MREGFHKSRLVHGWLPLLHLGPRTPTCSCGFLQLQLSRHERSRVGRERCHWRRSADLACLPFSSSTTLATEICRAPVLPKLDGEGVSRCGGICPFRDCCGHRRPRQGLVAPDKLQSWFLCDTCAGILPSALCRWCGNLPYWRGRLPCDPLLSVFLVGWAGCRDVPCRDLILPRRPACLLADLGTLNCSKTSG